MRRTVENAAVNRPWIKAFRDAAVGMAMLTSFVGVHVGGENVKELAREYIEEMLRAKRRKSEIEKAIEEGRDPSPGFD